VLCGVMVLVNNNPYLSTSFIIAINLIVMFLAVWGMPYVFLVLNVLRIVAEICNLLAYIFLLVT